MYACMKKNKNGQGYILSEEHTFLQRSDQDMYEYQGCNLKGVYRLIGWREPCDFGTVGF